MNKYDVLYWVCVVGTLVDLGLAKAAYSNPLTHEQGIVFFLCAIMFAFAAFTNYLRAKHVEESEED